MAQSDRIPVIVGVGEAIDRPDSPAQGLEPRQLIAAAIAAADADAGGGWLGAVDSIDVAKCVSWGYRDLAGAVAQTCRLSPARASNGPGSGERPTTDLFSAAERIASGQSRVAVICGGETQATVAQARRTGGALPWPESDRSTSPLRNPRKTLHPEALRYGLLDPIQVYPLFDVAASSRWGQTPAEAETEAAELMARYSAVAARNPFSWRGAPARRAADILNATPDNRMISWPYRKAVVAQPSVNLASAALVTSLAEARGRGVPEEGLVYFHDSIASSEPRQFLERDSFAECPSLDFVLGQAIQASSAPLNFVELYSCFPIVPRMALRALGLDPRIPPTVTGGLPYFGAPMNNYMGHAIASVVRALRTRPGGLGLLYGQGGFMTKHHALILGSFPPLRSPSHRLGDDVVAARRFPAPPVLTEYRGRAWLESFTVPHSRAGAPEHAIVVCRTEGNNRVLARVAVDQSDDFGVLTSAGVSPVGREGTVARRADGMNGWSFN
jgi:acetyl-CoA C-acetyltransferase